MDRDLHDLPEVPEELPEGLPALPEEDSLPEESPEVPEEAWDFHQETPEGDLQVVEVPEDFESPEEVTQEDFEEDILPLPWVLTTPERDLLWVEDTSEAEAPPQEGSHEPLLAAFQEDSETAVLPLSAPIDEAEGPQGETPKKRVFKPRPRLATFLDWAGIILVSYAVLTVGFSFFLTLGKMQVMYVVSNSMLPTFQQGDLLVLSREPQGLAVGDIVGYRAGWADDHVVTHRVMDIVKEEFVAKGDNNPSTDPPFPKEDLVGEVVGIIPKGGYFFNPYSIWGVGLLGLAATFLSDFFVVRPKRELPRKMAKALRKRAKETTR